MAVMRSFKYSIDKLVCKERYFSNYLIFLIIAMTVLVFAYVMHLALCHFKLLCMLASYNLSKCDMLSEQWC